MEISYGQKLMENSWNSFKNISWDISVRGQTRMSSAKAGIVRFRTVMPCVSVYLFLALS